MTAESSGPSLTDQVESLEKSRRHMMISLVGTLLLWFVPQILEDAVPDAMPHALKATCVFLGMAGGLLWVVLMLRYHRFQNMVRNRPELRDRLNDERIGQLRREAIYRGWVVLLVFVAAGVALAPFVALPVQALLLTLLMVGVSAPLLFFLWLDRG